MCAQRGTANQTDGFNPRPTVRPLGKSLLFFSVTATALPPFLSPAFPVCPCDVLWAWLCKFASLSSSLPVCSPDTHLITSAAFLHVGCGQIIKNHLLFPFMNTPQPWWKKSWKKIWKRIYKDLGKDNMGLWWNYKIQNMEHGKLHLRYFSLDSSPCLMKDL